MKRCPKCNRLHSDVATKCTQCGTALSGGKNAASSSGAAYQQPQPFTERQNESLYRQPQNTYQHPQEVSQPTNNYHQNTTVSVSTSANGEMGFGEAVSICFKKYIDPHGRAGRSEYWYFVLFNFIISFVAGFLDGFLGITLLGIPLLVSLVSLATCLPAWCVMVRRLHDVGHKWTFYFWAWVPFYGWYKLIAALVQDSEPGTNMYGPCPK